MASTSAAASSSTPATNAQASPSAASTPATGRRTTSAPPASGTKLFGFGSGELPPPAYGLPRGSAFSYQEKIFQPSSGRRAPAGGSSQSALAARARGG